MSVEMLEAFAVIALAFVWPVDARFVVSVVIPLAFVWPVDARFVVSVVMPLAFVWPVARMSKMF